MQPAAVSWRTENGREIPYSEIYGDVYFSSDDGLSESRLVFIEGNYLPERWSRLEPRKAFRVGELGFGTGLNFLLTAGTFLENASPGSVLHFFSCEKQPLSRLDLDRSLRAWPELTFLAQELVNQYPPLNCGFHFLTFASGRVRLSLFLGDVHEFLKEIPCAIDAWYLDGFAPPTNPEMWAEPVFEALARLSVPGTTAASYSAAGHFRRALEAQGFRVEKKKGHGKKWERTEAVFQGKESYLRQGEAGSDSVDAQTVAVIGGGLAGAWMSRCLAQRGVAVTLLERHSSLALEGSGNPVGLFMPNLTVQPTAHSRLTLGGMGHLIRSVSQQNLDHLMGHTGILQIEGRAEKADRFEESLQGLDLDPQFARIVTAQEASDLAGLPVSRGGIYLPMSGWFKMSEFCQKWPHSGPGSVDVRLGCDVGALIREGSRWRVIDGQGRLLADVDCVVVASAMESRRFQQTAWLPLRPVRGQVCYLGGDSGQPSGPHCVLMYDGYLMPQVEGRHVVGATFQPGDTGTEVRPLDNDRILSALTEAIPGFPGARPVLGGRAALRCSSEDFFPIAGRVPGPEEGLYVLTALSARGAVFAPLAAEWVASQILGQPAPFEASLVQALDPRRFILRWKRRGIKKDGVPS